MWNLKMTGLIAACVAPESEYKASKSRKKNNLQWAVNLGFILNNSRLYVGLTFSGQVSMFRQLYVFTNSDSMDCVQCALYWLQFVFILLFLIYIYMYGMCTQWLTKILRIPSQKNTYFFCQNLLKNISFIRVSLQLLRKCWLCFITIHCLTWSSIHTFNRLKEIHVV